MHSKLFLNQQGVKIQKKVSWKANQPGFGVSSYLVTHADKDGNFLEGSNTYNLHLDEDNPAHNFGLWFFTVNNRVALLLIN